MDSNQDLNVKLDPITRDTSFTWDGNRYTLRFDFDAIYSFYSATGVNPVLEPIGNDPLRFVSLLYVGLLRHHPEIKPETIKEWFASGAAAIALYKLGMEAFRAQLPDPEPAVEGEQPNPPSA